jgi:predicted GIY-YIG superfamily endonuclease
MRAPPRRNVLGTVYLIHLDAPIPGGSNRHYLGWSEDLTERLAAHATSTGAKFLREANRHGIAWHIVMLWPGATSKLERQIKKSKHLHRFCPVCPKGCGPHAQGS